MSRALVTLKSRADRERAASLIQKAPTGTRVEFKSARRSTDQNSKMWSALTDIARQLEWHSHRLTPNQWKILFIDALNKELYTVPDIYGIGVVALGRSSSDLTKDEMSQLLALIEAFGAEHSVKFNDVEDAEPTTIAPEQPEPVPV